jgi:hypothetical protein
MFRLYLINRPTPTYLNFLINQMFRYFHFVQTFQKNPMNQNYLRYPMSQSYQKFQKNPLFRMTQRYHLFLYYPMNLLYRTTRSVH